MPVYVLILFTITAVVLAVLFSPRVLSRPLTPGRRFWVGALQLCPLLALIWLMGNPTTDRSHHETVPQSVALLIDDSPSMSFEDGESGQSRYTTLQAWVSKLTQDWEQASKSATLQTFQFSELVPEGRSVSDFGAVIESLQRRIPADQLAAVIIASDGQDHGERSAAQAARQLGVPVHTIGIGPASAPEDIQARWLETPERAIPGSPFMVRWGVDALQPSPWSGQVRVLSGSEEIVVKDINLQTGESHLEEWASISLRQSGKHLLHLALESARTREKVAGATAAVTVNPGTPTLLILESRSTRLTQSLAQTVLEGGRYRILHAVPLPEGGGVIHDLFRPMPNGVTGEPWHSERNIRIPAAGWDTALGTLLPGLSLVVLGRSALDRYPQAWIPLLEQHLQHSRCGILVLPGAEEGAERLPEGGLHSLLTWTGKRNRSTQSLTLACPTQAMNHPAMAPVWSMLSQAWETGPDESFEEIPPYAQTLLSDGEGRPLIYESRLNLSKAVALSLSDLWTLRSFDTSTEGGGKRFVEGLWLGLVDYLAAGAGEMAGVLHVKPNPAVVGQTVQIVAEDPSLNPGPAVSGTQLRRAGQPDWKTLPLDPDPEWTGIGRASWIPREAGTFEIRYASSEEVTSLRVLNQTPETEDRIQNKEVLTAIATACGGQFVPFAERETLTTALDVPSRTVVREGQIALRNDLWTGIVLALIFCAGWGVRRLISLP